MSNSSRQNNFEYRKMFIFNLFMSLSYIMKFAGSISILYSSSSLDILSRIHNDRQINNIEDNQLVNVVNRGRRKSEMKCEEYVDAVRKKIWMLHPSESMPFSISVSCEPPINLLISGGESVESDEFAHMAAIGWRNNDDTIEYFCGGSLIAENWILTAAHCTQHHARGKPSVARLGSNQLSDELGEIIKINEIIRHPEYEPPKMYSDIALLKLYKSVVFRKNIRPACLQSQSHGNTKAVWAIGWGQTTFGDDNGSDNLLKVRLDIIENEKCSSAYSESSVIPNGFSTCMLCAGDKRGKGGKDTCKGDSGGPLQILHQSYCLYELVGITSFGKLCAMPEYPGVYTRISCYLDWIETIVWP